MSTRSLCPICGKKSNNLNITCKCGNTYCMKHRQPEDHKCTFDFKTFERKRLLNAATANIQPKIIESIN